MTALRDIAAYGERLPAPVKGALWMMAGAVGWSCMAAAARGLSDTFHTFEIVFFRSLFGGIFLLPWLFRVGIKAMATQHLALHMARSVMGLISVVLLFGALATLPVAEVAAIAFMRPIFASIAAILILHEVASGRRWTATLLGFAGVLIIVRPGFETISPGMWMALAASVSMACVSILVKMLTRTEAPDTIVMYMMIVFTPASLIAAAFVWVWPTPWEFLLLASTGFLGTITQRCQSRAYVVADATLVLPFEFTRLPFSALLGFILFLELPDGWTWVGGAVIFLATFALAHHEATARRRRG